MVGGSEADISAYLLPRLRSFRVTFFDSPRLLFRRRRLPPDDRPSDEARSAELASQLDEAFGGFSPETVARCREYLKLVAQQSMDVGLQAKFSSSDLVQETLLHAWRRGSQFRGTTESEFRGWLNQILQNHLIDQQRRYRGSAKRNVHLERPLTGAPSTGGVLCDLVQESQSPASKAELSEEAERLNTAIASLTEDQQRVLRLRNWDGLPFAEIGRLMGRAPAAARQLWVRALASLQQALEQRNEPGNE